MFALTTLACEQAISDSSEILKEIVEFQGFFKNRFPDVKLDQYNNGVNALPQYAHRRPNWEMLTRVPLYEREMVLARKEWSEPFENGSSFQNCFANHVPANQFPYFLDGTAITIEAAINQCLNDHGKDSLDYGSSKMARLVAAFREQYNGKPMQVDVSDPGMQEIYKKGKDFFWAKRGQNNFSCASCHIENAGNRLRGDVLGAALGQGTGFPAYRIRWAVSGTDDNPNPWSVLHRRYATCNLQAGAAPFALQSPEYIALEVYQAVLNRGIPIQSPSQRQ